MKKFYRKLFFSLITLASCSLSLAQVSVTATTGTTGPTSYTTLKAALDAVNAGTHTGSITVTITANTTETATATVNKSGTGSASYTTLVIKPGAGATATVSGNIDGAVLSILGSNVTIDGSNNASTTRNLTISNVDTSKISAVSVLSTGTAPVTNVTIKNTIIKSAIVGILLSDGASLGDPGYFTNISIQNNSIQNAVFGIYAAAAVAAGNGNGLSVTGNDINGTGANAIISTGVYVEGFDGANVSGNNIGNFIGTDDGDDAGIIIYTGTKNTVVEKNKISNLGYTGNQGYGAHGIIIFTGLASANIRVANNMISNLFGDGYNYTDAQYSLDNPIGIVLAGTQSGISIYYNSINLTGNTLNQANAMSAGIYMGSGSAASIVDNIIVNNLGLLGSTGHGSVGIFAQTGSTQFTPINYNDYFVNPSGSGVKYIGQISTTGSATLSAWQTASGGDLNSRNIQPVFVSATDLHLVPASNSALDNLGTPVAAVTTDIDGDARSATSPDMGVDEFVSTGADANAPSISYTPLTFSCSTGDRTLSGVTITDASGIPVTGTLIPRIYYKKSTGATWFSRPGVLTSGNTNNSTWGFTIVTADMGSLVAGDIIQYYVIAQDVVATPNISSLPAGVVATNVNTVTTHPSSPNSYTINSTYSGNYTVGAGGNYATLTAAVNAYNNGCLNGPVVFSLTDANYSSETLPIIISNPLGNATNTLTIKPAAGISPTITGTSIVAVLHIKGTDYVTIDGSNTVGGTSRDLTLTTTSTSIIPIIWITSGSVTDGALFNTVKNCKISGNSSSTTVAGILTGGLAFGGAADAPNSNNTISNNAITKVQNAIYVYGNETSFDQNWTVNGNVLGSASVVADKISLRGIVIGNVQNFSVSNNTITGVVTSLTSTTTATGILVAFGVNGGAIFNNKISDIKNLNTVGYGSNGIQLGSSSTGAGLNVYNNFVSDVAAYGYADVTAVDNGYGIIVTSGSGYNIYYNTVHMNTNQTLPASLPAAFNVTSDVTAAGAINLRNNIFVNSQTAGSAERYAIYSGAPSTVFAAIDYNDYYTTGPNLGFIGNNRSTLAAIQAGFGGNVNSKNILPVFASATDLHLVPASNTALDNLGTPIAAITTDIDTETRSATTPDMGADEFSGVCSGTLWTGATSTAWNLASNWCGSVVPSATSDVTIPSGTPNMPTVSTTSDVHSVTIANGATVTIASGGRLNIFGNLINSGTLTATAGTIAFQGTTNQLIPAITAGTVIMNGAGGITLSGNMTVGTTLTLTNGNITLGSNNITLNSSATGSVASHIITNGTGSVISNNITTTAVIIPVGPDAASYNPVTINNGQGRNFTVRVAIGVTPAIANSARAINRTWTISPSSTLTTNADLTLQYADTDANASSTPSALMEVGVHNGTIWTIASPAAGVTPVGTAAARQVTIQTTSFGATVVTNPGGITYPLAVPSLNADITSALLLPNFVNGNAVLRVNARRTLKIDWTITDMNGRSIMIFSKQVTAGQNDLNLKLDQLANGIYQLRGHTDKGITTILRFVKM